jgi:hypothetical protein
VPAAAVRRREPHQIGDSGAKVAVTLSFDLSAGQADRSRHPGARHRHNIRILSAPAQRLFTVAVEKKKAIIWIFGFDANTYWFRICWPKRLPAAAGAGCRIPAC